MLQRKSLLAISIFFALPTLAYAATNISEYNYNPNVTKQQTGVDIDALINCGYDYANPDCGANTPTVQKGYADNKNIAVGTDAGRTANKKENIFNINNPQSIGVNSIDDTSSIASYADTRDISKQSAIVDSIYGGSNTSNLTSTYNTNNIPTDQGLALKNQCLQFSDEQLTNMANGTNQANIDLANQCLVIRTVSVTNDKAISGSVISKDDALYKTAKDRSLKNVQTNSYVSNVNNTSTASINQANSQAYACELEPTKTEYSSKVCNANAYGRQQVCKQERVIECGEGVKGDRQLAECIEGMDRGTIKLVSSSNGRQNSFVGNDSKIFLNERWDDGRRQTSGTWIITFLVKNPAKVDMVLTSFYFDNKLDFYLNDVRFNGANDYGSDGTRVVNQKLNPYLKIGQNTLRVDMTNYDGPAAANFNITIGPNSYVGCSCVESWKTTCSYNKVGL